MSASEDDRTSSTGRRAIGSWLGGPRSAGGQAFGYPGERLGLPEKGAGSVAPMTLRLVALLIDWFGSLAIGALITHQWGGVTPLLIFYIELLLLTALTGSSAGQRILRVKVVRVGGASLSPLAVILRSILLFMVIPAAIYDRDGRGLHDRAVNSVAVRIGRH